MQINSINSSKNNKPSFQAAYKTEVSPRILTKLLEEYIPKGLINNKNNTILIGESQSKTIILKQLGDIAEKCNSSMEWVYMNAEKHGIELPKRTNKIPVWLFDDKDASKAKNYMLKNKIKLCVEIIKNTFFTNQGREVPQHLASLPSLINFSEKETAKFNKFAQKCKYEDTDFVSFILKIDESNKNLI